MKTIECNDGLIDTITIYPDFNIMVNLELENDNCNEFTLEIDYDIYHHTDYELQDGEWKDPYYEFEVEEVRIRPARMPKKYRIISEEAMEKIIDDFYMHAELKKAKTKALDEEIEYQKESIRHSVRNLARV